MQILYHLTIAHHDKKTSIPVPYSAVICVLYIKYLALKRRSLVLGPGFYRIIVKINALCRGSLLISSRNIKAR